MFSKAVGWAAGAALMIGLMVLAFVFVSAGKVATAGAPVDAPVGGTPSATTTPCAGEWAEINSVNPSGYNNLLFSMSARAPDDIWAVGYTSTSSQAALRTHTQHWDGTAWSIVPSPNANSLSNLLMGVHAVAEDDVWAVGYYYIPSQPSIYPQTLIMRWNGTMWSIVASPNASTWNNYLYSVEGTGPNDVWAVGYYDPSISAKDYDRTLAMHWDGTAWSIVESPNANNLHHELRGVTALAPNDVWAVGSFTTGTGAGTLTLHYTGAQWEIVPSANGLGRFSLLYSVSGVDAKNVWAVGYNNPDPGGSGNIVLGLILKWDGTAWTQESSPNPGTSTNFLNGVSAASSSNVLAVGTKNSGNGARTLNLRYNGGQWEEELGANAAGPNYVQDVVNLGSEAWTVGYYGPAGGYRTLTTRFTQGACGSPTTVATGTSTSTSTSTSVPTSTSTTAATETPVSTFTSTSTGVPSQSATAASTATSTALPTETVPPSLTATTEASGTATATVETASPTMTGTTSPVATATGTACAMVFADVASDHTFYPFIQCLACTGIVNGYPCGGPGEPCNTTGDPYFRPGNLVTRGQLAKIVAESSGMSEPVTGQSFADVLPGSTFYNYIERLYSREVMSGYPCGGVGEPCDGESRPYFRPNSSATRGQLAKIVSNAAGFADPEPLDYTFADMPPGSTFHLYVERLLINRLGVIEGYPCGGTGEPCDADNRPYFRPSNNLTRGQTSKIVTGTFFPDCSAP